MAEAMREKQTAHNVLCHVSIRGRPIRRPAPHPTVRGRPDCPTSWGRGDAGCA